MTQTLIIIILLILLLFLTQIDGHRCCIDGFEIIVPVISFTVDCRRSISPL